MTLLHLIATKGKEFIMANAYLNDWNEVFGVECRQYETLADYGLENYLNDIQGSGEEYAKESLSKIRHGLCDNGHSVELLKYSIDLSYSMPTHF